VASRVAAAFVIGLLAAGCAPPETEESFNEAFCEADVALEVAVTEILESQGREEWVSATRETMLVFRDDLARLPAWQPARDAKVTLANSVEAVLDLVESGAADAVGFGDRELALACASHKGEAAHVDLAGSMLARIGLDDTALECGAHWPLAHEATRWEDAITTMLETREALRRVAGPCLSF
jgi:L-asparaginase II